MIKRVLKYPINLTDEQTLTLPRYSRVLHVNHQLSYPTTTLSLWAEVPDDKTETETYPIWIVRTGFSLPNEVIQTYGQYFTTVLMPDGLVWHVYIGQPK